MLLITLNEWLGPSREAGAPKLVPIERQVAFATRLPLKEALWCVRNYQVAYNVKFHPGLEVNYRLLSVSTIENFEDDRNIFELLGVSMAEALSVED